MTSRSQFAIANAVLRDRFRHLVKPFVCDVAAFSGALREHGAVISGSLALYFFVHGDGWYPNDMDIYVSYEEYPAFLRTMESHPSIRFVASPRTPASSIRSSDSLDIAEVRKYTTPTNRSVDVIRSRRANPVSPLVSFWTSLLVNFIASDCFASAFPRMVFNGKGYIKEVGMNARDEAALRKYTSRRFQGTEYFAFVPELWGTWMDPLYWQKDYFSDSQALVVDLRAKVHYPVSSMPVALASDGWKLVLPFPAGVLLFSSYLLLTADVSVPRSYPCS